MDAVKSFFLFGELLKDTNATIPTLVPKRPNPSMMGEFRPIGANVPQRSILETVLLAVHSLLFVESWGPGKICELDNRVHNQPEVLCGH